MSHQSPRMPIYSPHLNKLGNGELTPREREIVQTLVGECLSLKEVGARLGISAHTVSAHLAKIYEKTGAHGLLQLARWAYQAGLVNWLAPPSPAPSPKSSGI